MSETRSPEKIDVKNIELLGTITLAFYREKTIENGKQPTDGTTMIIEVLDPMYGSNYSFRLDPIKTDEETLATVAAYQDGQLIRDQTNLDDQVEKTSHFVDGLEELVRATAKTLMRSFIDHIAAAQKTDFESQAIKNALANIKDIGLADIGVRQGPPIPKPDECNNSDCPIHNNVRPMRPRGEHIH
jgi:hypothetical protein